MRAFLIIALIGLGLAGGPARACDNHCGYHGYHHRGIYTADRYVYGERAGMRFVYSDEPGTLIRPYWRAPWHHHHYFPRSAKKPKYGRHERLSAPRRHLHVARSFRRNWSNADAFGHEWRREAPIYDAAPRAPRSPQPSDNVNPRAVQ